MPALTAHSADTPDDDAPGIVSLGCRLNAAEGEAMRRAAVAAGLSDVFFVNTCAVTAEAERQARQAIRRARREHPGARLVVTGCAAEIAPQRFAAMPEIDHVLGNAEKRDPTTFLRLAGRDGLPLARVEASALRLGHATPLQAASLPARARAFLAVQDGCDHRCTFCVIPFGRGPSRSIPMERVVEGAARLLDEGLREIVLTGVDITSWGNDLPGQPRLGDLVRALLARLPGLARLRLSSIDQAEADPALLAAFAEEPRLMPHVHLSLQHGNDLILKRMKRRHSRKDAIGFCDTLRRLRPDLAISADLIAGFPTETESHFADTLSLIDDCGLSQVHAFPFSARQQTPAARMPQLSPPVLRERATRLLDKGRSVHAAWLSSHVGQRVFVALEGSGPRDGRARTPQFAQARITVPKERLAAGDTVEGRVTAHDGQRLLVEVSR